MYSRDLAYIHDAGFGDFARKVAPEVARTLRNAGIGRGRVGEFGCGSGILAAYLHGAGYEIRGFDISPAMIRLARRNAPGASFRVASLSSARLPACDAVVGIGEVLTYVPGGAASLRRFFAGANAALRPGGVLIFDFIESARRRTFDTKTVAGPDWTIAVRAELSASKLVLIRQMSIARRTSRGVRLSRETHRVRIYNRRFIRGLLEQCGFTVTMGRTFGRHRLLPGDVAVVARKGGPV